MYCDGIRLINLKDRRIRKSLFSESHAFDDSCSDPSSDVSDVEIPSPKKMVQLPKKSTVTKNRTNLSKNSEKGGRLLKSWENGGPVKLLRNKGDEAEGYLYFKNYQNLDYDGLKDLVFESGCTFLSMKEQDNDYIKVRLKTENDVRKLYSFLKKDENYDVSVLLDLEDYHKEINKKRHVMKLAKFKHCDQPCKSLFKTHDDLLSAIEATNKLEADIRFETPKMLHHKVRQLRSPVDNKPQLKHLSRPRSKSPIIGTWNGHLIVMPATPPRIISRRPSNSKTGEKNDGERGKDLDIKPNKCEKANKELKATDHGNISIHFKDSERQYQFKENFINKHNSKDLLPIEDKEKINNKNVDQKPSKSYAKSYKKSFQKSMMKDSSSTNSSLLNETSYIKKSKNHIPNRQHTFSHKYKPKCHYSPPVHHSSAGCESKSSSDELQQPSLLGEESSDDSPIPRGNSSPRELTQKGDPYAAHKSASSSSSSSDVGCSIMQVEESPDESLISIFDIIASLMRTKVLNSLETSFRICNKS